MHLVRITTEKILLNVALVLLFKLQNWFYYFQYNWFSKWYIQKYSILGFFFLAFNLDKIWNIVTVNNFSLTEYNKDWSAEIWQLPCKQLGKSLIFFSLKKSKMMENIHSYLIVLLGACWIRFLVGFPRYMYVRSSVSFVFLHRYVWIQQASSTYRFRLTCACFYNPFHANLWI